MILFDKITKTFIRRCSSSLRARFAPRWKALAIRGTVCCLAVIMQAQSATEYQVKAAFLFNFAKFVEWPTEVFPAADAPVQICVLGQDPFGHEFEDVIADKTINNHRIEVIHPSGVPQARTCQILFVAASEKRQMRAILHDLRGASILTVGDTPGFAGMGGIINFVMDNGRVRFEINLKAAERAHIKISGRLLTVTKLILNDDDPAPDK